MRFPREKPWRFWFAWYPVQATGMDGGTVVVWLEEVWRYDGRNMDGQRYSTIWVKEKALEV